MLKVETLNLRYGGVAALRDVNFDVKGGELFSILGPNGAGKTSLFNCLSGLASPEGNIVFEGHSLTGLKPHQIAARGIGRTFQNLGLFGSMTVAENILVGSHRQIKGGAFSGAFSLPATIRAEKAARIRADELMELMDLAEWRDSVVSTLPYGTRKRVELAKAVASYPRLMLLDEPVAGMNQQETEDFTRYVLQVKNELKLTIVLIEHDVHMVMRLSDRILALDFGEVIGLGTPAEIQQNQRVISAYLGASDDDGLLENEGLVRVSANE